MYGSLRFKVGFREEVNKFIEAAKKHATTLIENKDTIICPCKNCKNCMAWTDVTIIRSYLIMRGFVEDYIVWIHHGETVLDDVDPEEDDVETLDYLDQYVAALGAQMANDYLEQGGDAGGWDGNDEGGANNDGGACVEDEDDLKDMIRALGPEILLKSPKDLENLERVKNHRRRLCMVLKRAVRHIGHCYFLCLSYSS